MTVYYVLASAAWGLLGLAVGFFLGRARPRPCSKETPVDPTPRIVTGAVPVEDELEVVMRRRIGLDQVLGIGVVLLAVVSVIYMAVTLNHQQAAIDRQERAIACQTDFNAEFADALNARTLAANAERTAQADLWTYMLSPQVSNAQRADALRAYITTLKAGDASRAANPLPARPACADGS